MCCRKGGTLSIPGVYIGFLDKIPIGALMNKGLTVKTGQTHVAKYHHDLLKRIENGEKGLQHCIPVLRKRDVERLSPEANLASDFAYAH